MILVGCLFSHINHLRVGMYNLPLQLWFFPGNLSENNFIEKIITVSCSVTAVFPFLPQTWHYSSLFRLCTGQYSSSISSYWTLWTPWTVCFGVSRFISFDHISQVLPRFCSSNSNGILLTLLCSILDQSFAFPIKDFYERESLSLWKYQIVGTL